jgi:hypothetical protein
MCISRQHAETEVTELVSAVCQQLLAVPGTAPDVIVALYLLADGTWYRFFLDAQLLFLDESPGPDPEEDLDTGQSYIDLSSMLGCAGSRIEEFVMTGGTLTMKFSGGASLVLREEDGRTRVLV